MGDIYGQSPGIVHDLPVVKDEQRRYGKLLRAADGWNEGEPPKDGSPAYVTVRSVIDYEVRLPVRWERRRREIGWTEGFWRVPGPDVSRLDQTHPILPPIVSWRPA